MFEGIITKALDILKSETTAKVVLKVGTGAVAMYLGRELTPEQTAIIGAAYLGLSAAIDGWWHKKHPEIAQQLIGL